ncbi:glycine cleavage system H protein, mitochondrial [Cataglyphis hispanica]|uniref:glycine cleavage system H protein, mitochondrial n=1 Tax=Cataglyphis hispanica TaxID=1086592 RepID=UPI00217FF389|nr:glycine cleavage system H protein, mitochondrial [Cataglyphis hispanica]
MARLMIQIGRCAMKTFISQGRNDLFGRTTQSRTSLVALRSITTTRCLRAERWYTEKHEWITVDGKVGIIGISDYAQDALGDVVFAQLPDVGSTVKKEEECGALESVKAASELISPVSGKVIEKNETVENKPSLINTSCYEEGWLFKVELNNLDEVKSLMNEEAYNTFLKSAAH